jgi:hypothetical protein
MIEMLVDGGGWCLMDGSSKVTHLDRSSLIYDLLTRLIKAR